MGRQGVFRFSARLPRSLLNLNDQQATAWNVDAFTAFFEKWRLAPSEGNFDFFLQYFKKHKARFVTAAMLEKVYSRAVEAGIEFEMKSVREPDGPVPDYTKRPNVEIRIGPAQSPHKPQPQTFDGFDLETGERRVYTEREIDCMSSEQMRKALQMTTRGTLELPTTGPGPRGRSY